MRPTCGPSDSYSALSGDEGAQTYHTRSNARKESRSGADSFDDEIHVRSKHERGQRIHISRYPHATDKVLEAGPHLYSWNPRRECIDNFVNVCLSSRH